MRRQKLGSGMRCRGQVAAFYALSHMGTDSVEIKCTKLSETRSGVRLIEYVTRNAISATLSVSKSDVLRYRRKSS